MQRPNLNLLDRSSHHFFLFASNNAVNAKIYVCLACIDGKPFSLGTASVAALSPSQTAGNSIKSAKVPSNSIRDFPPLILNSERAFALISRSQRLVSDKGRLGDAFHHAFSNSPRLIVNTSNIKFQNFKLVPEILFFHDRPSQKILAVAPTQPTFESTYVRRPFLSWNIVEPASYDTRVEQSLLAHQMNN